MFKVEDFKDLKVPLPAVIQVSEKYFCLMDLLYLYVLLSCQKVAASRIPCSVTC